jgi:hypothetical protein
MLLWTFICAVSDQHLSCINKLSGAVPLYMLHSITVRVWPQTLQCNMCREEEKRQEETAIEDQWDQLQSQSANQWIIASPMYTTIGCWKH